MIELINVSKNYFDKKNKLEVSALQDINLTVSAGEIFGVVGPSGAGKSTLIRCVNLLEQPTTGKVIVDKADLLSLSDSDLRAARRKIGMIFQHFNLLSSRTVYENVALPLKLIHEDKKVIDEKVMSMLEIVGLKEKSKNYPNQLSGGQKQRVAIARALITQPKVLLCDEATSALDPQTTHSILNLLKKINKKFKITILLITHEMQVIKEICHRLAILENGRIIEQNDVIDFFAAPQTQTAKEFVRSSLKQHLPDNIKNQIVPQKNAHTIPLLQISFLGNLAGEPVIAQMIQQFQINLNILQANIEHIRDRIVGIMIVEADTTEEKIELAMKYLSEKGLHVEIIGYVKRNS